MSGWLQQSKLIQTRKYYSSSQLHTLFKNDMQKKKEEGCINIITPRAFTRHLNTFADSHPLFFKIIRGFPPKTSYIFININDTNAFHSNTLRISPRKQIVSRHFAEELSSPSISERKRSAVDQSSSPPSKQPAVDPPCTQVEAATLPSTHPELVPSPTKSPSDVPSQSVIIPSTPEVVPSPMNLVTLPTSENNSFSSHKSETILNFNKSDFESSICFFMGKERAKQICNSETGTKNTNTVISFKVHLKTHLLKQIEKLTNAFVTVNGWKEIVHNYDNVDDVFSEHAVFDYRLKAFYLQKLYSMSLRYYDSISNFLDIAALAIVEANSHLGVLPKKQMQHFSNPKSLLRIFVCIE